MNRVRVRVQVGIRSPNPNPNPHPNPNQVRTAGPRASSAYSAEPRLGARAAPTVETTKLGGYPVRAQSVSQSDSTLYTRRCSLV